MSDEERSTSSVVVISKGVMEVGGVVEIGKGVMVVGGVPVEVGGPLWVEERLPKVEDGLISDIVTGLLVMVAVTTLPPPVGEMLGVISGSSREGLVSAGAVVQPTGLSGVSVEAGARCADVVALGLCLAGAPTEDVALVDITGAEMAAVVYVCLTVWPKSVARSEMVG